MKLAIAQLNPTVGDFKENRLKIEAALKKAKEAGATLVLFSEMVLTGYPPEDFLLHPDFISRAEKTLLEILPATKGLTALIGTVRKSSGEKALHNTAAVLTDGKLIGYQDKTLLPTYDVFDERRYFEPASATTLFQVGAYKVAITICEDIWPHAGYVPQTRYRADPVEEIARLNPDLVVNLSASPYHYRKFNDRLIVACKVARTLKKPFVLCNQVGGNDSLIFDGNSLVINSKGEFCDKLKGFEEDFQIVDLAQLEPKPIPVPDDIADLYTALVRGTRDYFHKSGFKKACLGLSGGIDSAVVACVAVEALGHENVLAVAMPSRYSSPGSVIDAKQLAKNLDIRLDEISIEKLFKVYLEELTPHFAGKAADATEENLQARIRGMILMALSNKHNFIVLSTGNKSELAMGYATLYGDMTGGLAILSDVTKERVYQLAAYINRDHEIIPRSTIEKPPSAELKPGQKDSDTLPPYPIIDTVLEAYVEKQQDPETIASTHNIPLETVLGLIKKIHQNEYKRRQAPPGLRITEKAFTAGRKFPIIQKFYGSRESCG